MFPFSSNFLAKSEDMFDLKQDPSHKYYCGLSSDTIYVFDQTFMEISRYTRSQENVAKYGPVHWIIWIDSSNIAFGTCAGDYFSIPFNGEFSNTVFNTNIGNVITGVFIKNNTVGVCTFGPKIIYIDSKAQILSTVDLISEAKFMKNIIYEKNIAYIAESHAFIGCEQARKVKIPNVTTISLFMNTLAVGTLDGNVSLFDCKTNVSTQICDLHKPINYVSFIHNGRQLLIIDNEGTINVFSFVFAKVYQTSFSNFSFYQTILFDESSMRLIYINELKEIRSIDFMKLSPPFAFTSSQIMEIPSKIIKYQIPFNDVSKEIRALPYDLFPIFQVEVKDEDNFCILGSEGISVINIHSSFFDPTKHDDVKWLDDSLVCLKLPAKVMFYSSQLIPLKQIQLSSNPVAMTTLQSCLVFSYLNSIEIHYNEKRTQHEFSNSSQIHSAFAFNHDNYFILYRDGKLKCSQGEFTNVNHSWSNFNKFCFLQNGMIHQIDSSNKHSKVIGSSLSTYGDFYYELDSNLEIKRKVLDSSGIQFYEELIQTDKIKEFILTLTTKEEIEPMIVQLSQMKMEVAIQFLDHMSSMQVNYLNDLSFDFEKYYYHVSPKTQAKFLIFSIKPVFLKLVEYECENKVLLLHALIAVNSFIRAFIFAQNKELNFCEAVQQKDDLKELSIKKSLEIIQSDPMRGENEILKIIGMSFKFIGLDSLSIACFLSQDKIDERKITAIINDNEELQMKIMRYTRDYPNEQESRYIKSLEIGF